MDFLRAGIAACLLVAAPVAIRGETPPVIHYAPAENLERIDVSLIDSARRSLDMAAYVLTDWPVISALDRAARRGVAVRLYLDGGWLGNHARTGPFRALLDNPGVAIRVKRAGAPLMHLKSYQIDGRVLRTGAANFSASGLKRQDNDLVVIESKAAVARFLRRFEAIYAASENFPPRDAGDDPRPKRKRERWGGSFPPAVTAAEK